VSQTAQNAVCSAGAISLLSATSNSSVISSGYKHRLVAPSDVHSKKFTPPSVVWFPFRHFFQRTSAGYYRHLLTRTAVVLTAWTAHIDRIKKCLCGCKTRYFSPLCFQLECVGYRSRTADCLSPPHRAAAEVTAVLLCLCDFVCLQAVRENVNWI
jgi:hypothetical protein